MRINYHQLEKLNAQFGVSAAESATAISRLPLPFLPFSIHAADDRRLNRTPAINKPPTLNPDLKAQERDGRLQTFADDNAEMSADDCVNAALDLVSEHGDDPDGADHLDRAAKHLNRAAAIRRDKKSGGQHLKMR